MQTTVFLWSELHILVRMSVGVTSGFRTLHCMVATMYLTMLDSEGEKNFGSSLFEPPQQRDYTET